MTAKTAFRSRVLVSLLGAGILAACDDDTAVFQPDPEPEPLVDGAAVTVNDANVLATDILARNGVIHVIDKVLIP